MTEVANSNVLRPAILGEISVDLRQPPPSTVVRLSESRPVGVAPPRRPMPEGLAQRLARPEFPELVELPEHGPRIVEDVGIVFFTIIALMAAGLGIVLLVEGL